MAKKSTTDRAFSGGDKVPAQESFEANTRRESVLSNDVVDYPSLFLPEFVMTNRVLSTERKQWGYMQTLLVEGPVRSADAIDISAFLVLFHDNTPHSGHHHPDHHERLYVRHGKLEQIIEDRTYILYEGDSVDIPRRALHSAMPLSRGTVVQVQMIGIGLDYFAVDGPFVTESNAGHSPRPR